MRADAAAAFERAAGALLVEAGGHRDRTFDGLDDIGKADRLDRPGEADPAGGAAGGGEQSGGGQATAQLLRGGQRHAGIGGQAQPPTSLRHGERRPSS